MTDKPLSLHHYWLRDLVREHAPGKQHALPLPEVARRMGVTTRKVQTLKADLLKQGIIICSSCDETPGLYWPTDASEIAPYCRNLEARVEAQQAALAIIYRNVPALRPVALRTPPLRYVAKGPAVTAQMAFDALEATA